MPTQVSVAVGSNVVFSLQPPIPQEQHNYVQNGTTFILDLPTKEQEGEYKNRLFQYTGVILKDLLLGGANRKLKLFIKKQFQMEDTQHLTVVQWDAFLGFLDKKLKELGPVELAKLIDREIGEDSDHGIARGQSS